MNNRTKIK